MWINRAFLLEHKVSNGLASAANDPLIFEASDAYRAALQVMKHPDALLGLAVTGMLSRQGRSIAQTRKKKNSLALLKEFLAVSSIFHEEAQLLSGLLEMEEAAISEDTTWGSDAFEKGRKTVKTALLGEKKTRWLNMETMNHCLEESKAATIGRKRDDPDFNKAQIRILRKPNDPIRWLILARDAISKTESTSPRRLVDEALKIAQKASDMLTHNLNLSHHVADKSGQYLPANMVAEALSLVCSLQRVRNDQRKHMGYDIQRAIMMSPNNKLARETFQCCNTL